MKLGIAKTAKLNAAYAVVLFLNYHKAVQCDKCEMWVHNNCSFVTDFQYETMQNSSCTWICPKM